MHTSQGSASLTVHLLGPHPIVAHFLQRLNLSSIVHQAVGRGRDSLIDQGTALAVMVHNVLDSPAPLYRIAEWAAPVASSALSLSSEQKKALNDDRMARMLDSLVSQRGGAIWFRLALRLIKQFQIETPRVHYDTTSVTFHGQYKTAVADPRITHGHNKDHRPDLKQLVFGLSVSSDGAVPLTHHVFSGNRTDDTVHQFNHEQLRALLAKNDFIYVADAKLATTSNLKTIAAYGGQFVTVLPRTRKEDRQFRQQLQSKRIRWKKILEIPNKRRKSNPPDVYDSCASPSRTADGFGLIWVRSRTKAAEDQAIREHKLNQARSELTQLQLRLNHYQFRFPRLIRVKVREILKRTSMEAFLRVSLKRQIQQKAKRGKRGRPALTDPVRWIKFSTWTLDVQLNEKALGQEKRTDGVFPLVNRLEKKTSKKEVLLIYKYQPYVEKRFSQLKTDLEVAPIYLKKPRRCAGLIHAYFVALVVASLIERSVRQGMKREGITELPLFPEGRKTSTPTCPRILEAFRGVCWHEFQRGDETICFPIKLNSLQKTLLRLLDVPLDLYK